MTTDKPKSSARRVQRHEEKLVAQGGRRMNLKLTPEANEALERLSAASGDSGTAVINRLIVEAARRS